MDTGATDLTWGKLRGNRRCVLMARLVNNGAHEARRHSAVCAVPDVNAGRCAWKRMEMFEAANRIGKQ